MQNAGEEREAELLQENRVAYSPEPYTQVNLTCAKGHRMTIHSGHGLFNRVAYCKDCEEYRYQINGEWK
jgi:hypothetical protein